VLSLVYLTTRAPSEMASDLMLAGYAIWEALAVSEVLYLCEHHNIDVVVIAPEVEDADIVEVQMRRMTLTLKPGAAAKDVMWELAQLFPSASQPSIQ
jgi:hypothetical protein